MKSVITRYALAFVLVVLAGSFLSVFEPAEAQAASVIFSVAASASPSQVSQSTLAGINLAVTNTNSKTTSGVVTLTIKDPNGLTAYTRGWPQQNFSKGKPVVKLGRKATGLD